MAPIGMDDLQKEVVEREALGMDFSSAEARYAYQRARRLHLVIKYVGGVILLVGFGYAMFLLGGGSISRTVDEPQGGARGHTASAVDIDPIGSPDAKVKILAILPDGSDCHSEIVKFLTTVAKENSNQIHAEFVSMETFSDRELSARIGQVCAAVLVNEKAEFDHMVGTKICHHISLVGTVPTHYAMGDLGLVINQVYAKEYGADKPPPVDVSQYKTSCPSNCGDSCGADSKDGHGHATEDGGADLPNTTGNISLPGFLDMQKE